MKNLILILLAFVLVFGSACASSKRSDNLKRGRGVITDCPSFQ